MLSAPITVKTVFMEYSQDGDFYRFDQLQNKAVQTRKESIERNPLEFLYSTHPTNKGTLQTAEMLMDAQNEEELAAIWIAATTKELYELKYGNGIGRYANILHMAACEFLQTRYYLWQHAMKRLVSEILIPPSLPLSYFIPKISTFLIHAIVVFSYARIFF